MRGRPKPFSERSLETQNFNKNQQIFSFQSNLGNQKEPFLICYPFGIYSSSVIKLAEKYYSLGLSTDNKCWVTGGNNYAIGRHYVDNDLTGQDFLENVSWFIHN